MLPSVATLEAFVVDADGSALCARFRDADGMQLELVFPAHDDLGAPDPELHRHVPHQYTSKLDGGNLAYTTREDTPLSWADARRLLEQLAALADATTPGASRWLPEMRQAATRRGVTLRT